MEKLKGKNGTGDAVRELVVETVDPARLPEPKRRNGTERKKETYNGIQPDVRKIDMNRPIRKDQLKNTSTP